MHENYSILGDYGGANPGSGPDDSSGCPVGGPTGGGQGVLVANEFVAFLLLMLSLALVYKLVPATHVRWRDVWLGSAITAILTMLGWQLILAFVRGTKIDSILELASFIVLILIGIYYISLIVILGAMICRAFATTFGPQAGQSDTQGNRFGRKYISAAIGKRKE